MSLGLARLPLLVFALFGLAFPAHAAEDACPAAPAFKLALPKLRAAVGHGEVVIVAFGSSSTRGAAARDAAHAYPAQLQAALSRAWPSVHVAVLNRGIDGEDAADELVRLGRDVIGARPNLVIWQLGANSVLRDVGVKSFTSTTRAGIKRLKDAGAEIILVDNQRAPRILAAPRHAAIEAAIVEIAATTGVGLFSRSAMMDAWRDGGHGYERFIAADGLHQNDLGYRCLAEALAATLVAAVR